MENNNSTNNTDATRPRPDVALVETETTGASGDRPSVVIGEDRPSSRVDNTTPLPGEEVAGSGFAGQSQNNTSSSQSNPPDSEATTESNNGSVAAQYIVCQGAMCKCTNGTSMPRLKVSTHKKHYVNDNGNNKLIATVKDITFEPSVSPFGTCGADQGRPCSYVAQQWQVPNNSRFPTVEGLDILTEKGTLECQSKKGKIEFKTHGQN